MPIFGKRSKQNRDTCHPDLIKILNEAIKYFDFTVLEGHRTTETQQKYYAIGRTIKLNSGIITNKDGVINKSRHQSLPSTAADCAPYPIDWSDIDRFKRMGAIILREAEKLGIKISWGGKWKSPVDYPHFQLRKS